MATQSTPPPTLDDVMKELTKIRRDMKKEAWVTPATLAISCAVAGLGLTLTEGALSKAQFGWGLVVIGIGYFIYCNCKWSRIDKGQTEEKQKDE